MYWQRKNNCIGLGLHRNVIAMCFIVQWNQNIYYLKRLCIFKAISTFFLKYKIAVVITFRRVYNLWCSEPICLNRNYRSTLYSKLLCTNIKTCEASRVWFTKSSLCNSENLTFMALIFSMFPSISFFLKR